ncbi:MAG: hypothetical protein IBX61_05810 [Thermoleophilia bacterium]|nr:hypothetical protein [Thermoleophilia bacterium]
MIVSPIDVKELAPENGGLRAFRIMFLRESVASRCYHVNPSEIALVIIREAMADHVWRRQRESAAGPPPEGPKSG